MSVFRVRSVLPSILLLPICAGCVALGLPSERYHDPSDHGGLLGDWRSADGVVPAAMPAPLAEEFIEEGAVLVPNENHAPCGSCLSDDASYCFPMDLDPVTGAAASKPPAAPEVPWPRYHPVPTRPVLGG
ncbi:MAG: hypothetical protein AAF670_02535 [Planctomycetota bacterium]